MNEPTPRFRPLLPNIEALLAEHEEEWKNAKEFDNWMPPAGNEYHAVVGATELFQGKEGSDLYIKTSGELLSESVPFAPELAGRTFCMGFWGPKTFGRLKSLCRQLSGQPFNGTLKQAAMFLMDLEGIHIQIKVTEVRGKRGTMTNVEWGNIVSSSDVPETDAPATPE